MRTAKTATHAMATASAAATVPALVTQTEHAAVISDDLGQRTNRCDISVRSFYTLLKNAGMQSYIVTLHSAGCLWSVFLLLKVLIM